MNKGPELNRQTLANLLGSVQQYTVRYAVIFFLLFVAAVYGFVLFKITSYSSSQPNDSDVSSQAKAFSVPRIPSSAVDQLQSLQDHSVSVKALFDAARNNPFQE